MSFAQSAVPPRGRLFLVRHGQSTFNAENRFTGWLDPPLTRRGEDEAHAVARRLKDAGVQIDAAFSSTFQRTIRSLRIMLDDLGSVVAPSAAGALNERDYGELTGLNKAETTERWGAVQVQTWRRSYAVPPPGGESLRDTASRVAPFYLRNMLPVLLKDAGVLVVSHGNTLRALIAVLEELSPVEVEALEIATGEILVFDVAADARVSRTHLLSPDPPESVMTNEKDENWMREALEEEERVEHGLPANAPADKAKDAQNPTKRPTERGGPK